MSDKLADSELIAKLIKCPRAGTAWRHYKTGNLYWVQTAAISESTQEPLVIYHRQSSSLMFARPLSEWTEIVEHDGKQVQRFSPVNSTVSS